MTDDFLAFNPRVVELEDDNEAPVVASEPVTALPGDAQRWLPPVLDDGFVPRSREGDSFVSGRGDGVSAVQDAEAELLALREQAYNEGFAQGLADAEAQSKQILAGQCQQIQDALVVLAAPQAAIDQQIEDELLDMTLQLAKQLLRRDIARDPALLRKLIGDSVKILPVLTTPLQIYLNPQDEQLLRSLADDDETMADWQFIGDAGVSPGGYRIHCGDSTLDDTVETRLAGLVDRLFDEEGGQ